MQELKKLGKIMSVVIDNCDDCPLEKVCNSCKCETVWENFLKVKVKEDGVEECKN